MRRPRLILVVMATSIWATTGCSILGRPGTHDPARLTPFDTDDRDNVPDAIMLRDHIGSQYHDSLAP